MRIAIVSAVDFVPWQFRSEFIATLIHNGHDVTVITRSGPYVERLKAIGANHYEIPASRFISFLTDFLYFFRLYFAFRRLKPDIVYTMTAKPNIIGPLVSKLARVPRTYSLYGGIGFFHSEGGNRRTRLFKRFGRTLIFFGSKFADGIVFQNHEDRSSFLQAGAVTEDRSLVVNGSGVNLHEFSAETVDLEKIRRLREEFGVPESGVLVAMISRITENKGVLDYVEASRSFVDQEGRVRFIHVGSFEKGSLESVSPEQIRKTSTFEQVGFRTDVRDILFAADIVVLPSFHREGVPNTLLEALAMRRPIVTTDNVGCREVVDDGVNGFLVPVRDSAALAAAIRQLVDDPALRKKMGEAGYEKAERQFTVESVNKEILEKLFRMENVRIPDFYTEEIDGDLVIHLSGEQRRVPVPSVARDHKLN